MHRKGIPLRKDVISLTQRLMEAGLADRWMEEVLKSSGSGKVAQGKVSHLVAHSAWHHKPFCPIGFAKLHHIKTRKKEKKKQ